MKVTVRKRFRFAFWSRVPTIVPVQFGLWYDLTDVDTGKFYALTPQQFRIKLDMKIFRVVQ